MDIRIFPNPSHRYFYIHTTKPLTGMNIEISNTKGQIIYSGKINDKPEPIDLSQKSKGIYVVRIFGNNLNKTMKIILE